MKKKQQLLAWLRSNVRHVGIRRGLSMFISYHPQQTARWKRGWAAAVRPFQAVGEPFRKEKNDLSFQLSSQLIDIDIDRNIEARQLLEIKSVDWLIISERYI